MANSKEKSLFNSVTINPQGREELVGKRFLVVNQTSPKPKLSRIGDWHWKAGVIRCSSHVDIKDPELQVRKHDDLRVLLFLKVTACNSTTIPNHTELKF